MLRKRKKRSLIWAIPKETLQDLLDKSSSIVEVLTQLNFNGHSGNHRTLNERLKAESFNLDRLTENRNKLRQEHMSGLSRLNSFTEDKIFCVNSTYSRGTNIKKKLLSGNYCVDMCDICKSPPVWNNKILSLQVDHKNGISNDNRVENLRLLCPNCHSQTDNFSGKKKRKTW